MPTGVTPASAPRAAALRPALGRHIVPAFALLGLAALAGFAKPYWLQLAQQPSAWVHVHAAAMAAWCVLLVLQPYLAARGRLAAHRAAGRLAWVIAPSIVASALVLAWVMTRPAPGAAIEAFRYGLFFVQLATTALFALSVAQALRWRHRRAPHARWMVASGLLLIDPVFARVLLHGLGQPAWLVEYGSVVASLAAFAVAAWADRRAAEGRHVFAFVGFMSLLMQAGALGIGSWEPWRAAMQALLLR